MEYKDYYKTLEVERGASQDDIKRAYRRLARKYHPDVSKEKDAEAQFQEVNEAYQVLQDPEKRKAYDQFGKDWKAGQDYQPPPGWQQQTSRPGAGFGNADDFSDFFSSIFGQGGPGRGSAGGYSRAQMKGEDINASIQIPIEDAYTGASRSLTLNVPELDAQGTLNSRQRKLNVKIPKGVGPNQRIRLEGQGGPGFGGAPAGDLFLKVEFEPHKLYTPQGKNLYIDLPIAPWEAALGATIKVPTLGGTLDVKIPAGARSGQKLRLKGRGLPGKPAGDQYAVLQIAAPKAESEEVKKLYQQLQSKTQYNPRAGLGV